METQHLKIQFSALKVNFGKPSNQLASQLMSNTYQFLKKLIVRTPALPFADDISESFLKNLMAHPPFAEALYLASPLLFHEAKLWEQGTISDPKKVQKIIFSLTKYYSRMSSRCTPFGMFAGCAVVNWDEKTELTLSTDIQRSTRLDMHYAGALAQFLAEIPAIKKQLLFFPNSSIYQIGSEIRYVEYKYLDGKRTHQLSAFEYSEYIALVLEACKNGAKIEEIIPQLIDEDITEEEAEDFIVQLIDAQLLIHELEPAITSTSFVQDVINTLKKIEADDTFSSTLESIMAQLQTIDNQKINEIDAYQKIIKTLEQFTIPIDEGKLFQTDLVKVFQQNTLQIELQEQLQEILELLIPLSEATPNKNQEHFIQKFTQRYENQEIPILLALDTETGIGYGETGKKHNTPLADGFVFSQDENQSISWSLNPFQQYLLQEWLNAFKNNSYEVSLSEKTLRAFAQKNIKTPTSISLSFRLTGDENLAIYLENVGGSNAVSALGRFAHADENVKALVQEITQKEQALNPNVVFAEVIHLPENRIGNILLHPAFWSFEIPYLAKSSLPKKQQITLDDILVSVDSNENRIVLRSKKLNKEIIPRLSNAHNYSADTLPIYHFLCDLQQQGLNCQLKFNWQNIVPKIKFSPRLTYKKIILEAATWHFEKEDFRHLLSSKKESLIADFEKFKEKWNIPKRFVLADFDNELLVDSDNLLSIQTWLDTIKNREKIELKEYLFFPEKAIIRDEQGMPFCNQFIASLLNKKTVYEGKVFDKTNSTETSVERNFSLGSEWIYLKFYAGTKTADDILAQSIKPVLENLLEENLIDKWFFIRYLDPEKHIRLRLHLVNQTEIGKVILALKESIEAFEQENIIWKTQFDTYQREIERYGIEAIEYAEDIFFQDSLAVISMLEQSWGDEREHLRWQFAIQLIDTFLDDFGFTLLQKLDLMKFLKESFSQEFKVDKSLKLQIDKRFRENRKNIESILDNNSAEHQVFSEILAFKSTQTAKSIEQIKVQKNDRELLAFVSSQIHLSINRAIADNQRFHELLIYDFMYRFYQASIAKTKTPHKI